MSNQGPNLIFG